eukprot:CAMPEP_0170176608 /NCGR_PEP_ID=MMETSP0040_2-20121228/9444_1 /TAXON_ID=641309 /ORGANISM="Lotharella oceanica, Strain CCMP622" /LENGTH=300 /DNA_ID=CAMNT_0010418981 /DNA_START=30 /DNA_END=932 /DNA_ORIENTATION=+
MTAGAVVNVVPRRSGQIPLRQTPGVGNFTTTPEDFAATPVPIVAESVSPPKKDASGRGGGVNGFRDFMTRVNRALPFDVGTSRKGKLAAKFKSPPYDYELAADGEWGLNYKERIGDNSLLGLHGGTHGGGIQAVFGTQLGGGYLARYCFELQMRAPDPNPSPYYLRIPRLDARWAPKFGQMVSLDHALWGGNVSLSMVPDPFCTGVTYSRTFSQQPLQPSVRYDLSTQGLKAEARIRGGLRSLHPNAGFKAATGAVKTWGKGPLKLQCSLELIFLGVGKLVAVLSGGMLEIRPIFGDDGT